MIKKILLLIIIILSTSVFSASVYHDAGQINPGQFASGDYNIDGNLGIGVIPNTILDINRKDDSIVRVDIKNQIDLGNANAGVILQLKANDSSGYLGAFPSDYASVAKQDRFILGTNSVASGLSLMTGSGQDIKFFSGNESLGSERMTIGANGNVGIGTTSPSLKLVIYDNQSGALTWTRVHNPNSDAGSAAAFSAKSDVSELSLVSFSSNYGSVYNGSSMVYTQTGNLFFGTNSLWRVVIQNNTGNVGIGTSNPQTELHIDGGIFMDNTGYADDNKWGFYSYGDEFQFTTRNNDYTYKAAPFTIHNDSVTYSLVIRNSSIGIGSANPLSKLHINGAPAEKDEVSDILVLHRPWNGGVLDGRFASFKLGTSSDLGNPGRLDFSLSSPYATPGSNPDSLGSMDNIMTLVGTGNVGIGTTNPSAKLDVRGNMVVRNNSGTYTSLLVLDDDPGYGASIEARSNNSYSRIALVALGPTVGGTTWGIANANITRLDSNVGSALLVGTHVNSPLVFGTNANERMRINSNGNVGIGTINPTTKLEIYGSRPITFNPSSSPYGVRMQADNGGWTMGYQFLSNTSSLLGGFGAAGGGTYISRYFVGTYNTDEKMTILDGGNVGVGTTTPIAKLSVGGNQNSQSFELVDSRAIADPNEYDLFNVTIPVQGMFYGELDLTTHRVSDDTTHGGFKKHRILISRASGGSVQQNSVVELTDFGYTGTILTDTIVCTQYTDVFTCRLTRDHSGSPSVQLTMRLTGQGYKVSDIYSTLN